MPVKVMVSFPAEFLAEVDRIASEEHRSRSELVREAIGCTSKCAAGPAAGPGTSLTSGRLWRPRMPCLAWHRAPVRTAPPTCAAGAMPAGEWDSSLARSSRSEHLVLVSGIARMTIWLPSAACPLHRRYAAGQVSALPFERTSANVTILKENG